MVISYNQNLNWDTLPEIEQEMSSKEQIKHLTEYIYNLQGQIQNMAKWNRPYYTIEEPIGL